eukprot:9710859-Alexandrium_andersonii.AAC.1
MDALLRRASRWWSDAFWLAHRCRCAMPCRHADLFLRLALALTRLVRIDASCPNAFTRDACFALLAAAPAAVGHPRHWAASDLAGCSQQFSGGARFVKWVASCRVLAT